uniref:Geminin coiled-coil domain containing n=1 Tax=Monodelphis domestica TaxID=13616 RepID=A0A5F8H9U0_MONDO
NTGQLLIPSEFLSSVSNVSFLLLPFLSCLASPHILGPHPFCFIVQSTRLSCQDQHFAGGQEDNCPHSTSTSASSVDVSRETWVSFWAAGLLDNREQQQEPQAQGKSYSSAFPSTALGAFGHPNIPIASNDENVGKGEGVLTRNKGAASTFSQKPTSSCIPEQKQCNDLDFLVHEDYAGTGNQLSSQLYRNKQLQDTLLQKEEELARLHEENNSLRQYLNSALVKCLEERAKKLLMQSVPTKVYGCMESGKRKPRERRYSATDTPHPKNAKRKLLSEFAACEGPPNPAVDSWVLKTLGLKDLDTIDDSVPANYSALISPPERHTFPQFPAEEASYEHSGIVGLPIPYENGQATPLHNTGRPQAEDLAFFSGVPHQAGALQTLPSLSPTPFPSFNSPAYSPDVSPNKTDVVFSTSLSPHCHVKTHSFQQGQAFVRRDEEGWKFTWVPKQS